MDAIDEFELLLQNAEELALVGVSLGGLTAISIASRFPGLVRCRSLHAQRR